MLVVHGSDNKVPPAHPRQTRFPGLLLEKALPDEAMRMVWCQLQIVAPKSFLHSRHTTLIADHQRSLAFGSRLQDRNVAEPACEVIDVEKRVLCRVSGKVIQECFIQSSNCPLPLPCPACRIERYCVSKPHGTGVALEHTENDPSDVRLRQSIGVAGQLNQCGDGCCSYILLQ